MIGHLLLAALLLWAGAARGQGTAVRPGPLGPGLTSNPTVYNPGTQLPVSEGAINLQVFYDGHATSCIVNSTCGSTNDAGKLLTATAGGVVFTVPAPGAAGTAGYSFGYVGSTYGLTITGGSTVLGNCGTITALSFGVSLTTNGSNWVCSPYANNTATGASLSANNTWTAGQAVTPVPLTDASSIAVNAALGNSFTVTLTAASHTLANPTGVIAGQNLQFAVSTGTGFAGFATGTNYKYAGGTAPTWSTAASKTDVISCWAATTSLLYCAALIDVR